MEENKQSQTNQYKYHAFISYRHADNKVQGRQWATWLHQAIETYEVPKDLVGKKNGRGDVIPARIYPIFRDEEELPAHADLGTSIVGALEQTNLLVVLCSPRAVASTYVADEIDYFKKLGGSDRIIAAMIDGEPNTSWDDSKLKLGFTKEDECFPIPLQFEYDQDGNPTDKHAEPIAADFRINNDGKPEEGFTTPAAYREHLNTTTQLDNKTIEKKVENYQQQLHLMLLKIIAGILGVPLGELTQRDKEYQLEQERLKAKKLRRWLGAVAMLAIVAVGASVFAYMQKEEAIRQRDRAEKLLNQVRTNLEFMNYDLRDVLNKYAPIEARANALKKIDVLVEAIQGNGSRKEQKKDNREIAISYINKAEIILQNIEANPHDALVLLNKAHEVFKELVQLSPESKDNQRDLSTSYDLLGDIQVRLGNTSKALAHYQASMDITKKLTKLEPSNFVFQRDLSIPLTKLGDIQLRLGNTSKALGHYQASIDIDKKLTELHPSNIELKIDLSRSHDKLGDLQLRLGNVEPALAHYQASIDIDKKLTELDPSNTEFQHDLSVSYEKQGSLQLSLGNTESALAHYQDRMNIAKKLTEFDPSNAGFQRGLSVSYEKLGDLHLRLGNAELALVHYQASMDIRKKLTELDPSNADFQRGLSISYNKLGDLQLGLGKAEPALVHYQESMGIRKKLTERAPSNTEFQRDLSVSHERLGNLQLRLDNTSKALVHYQESLDIRKKLTELDPSNTSFQRDLFVSYYKLATSHQKEGLHKNAFTYYSDALSILNSGLAKYDKGTNQKYLEIISTEAKRSENSLSD